MPVGGQDLEVHDRIWLEAASCFLDDLHATWPDDERSYGEGRCFSPGVLKLYIKI